MMHFFHSLIGGVGRNENFPEDLVASAIERAVEGTDPWIRAVSGYKRKLRPAVLRAMDHVTALVDGMSPAIGLEPAIYGSDPRLRNFFISTADMRRVIENDRNLAAFRRNREGIVLPRINALLTMEKQEKTVLGAEISGNIILRDVPQVTVSFESHQLVDPSESETKTRRQLKRRAFDYLLGLALKHISMIKTKRADLERLRTGLQARLQRRQREPGTGDVSGATTDMGIADMQNQLGQIERQLLDLGREDRVLDGYLDIVHEVLNQPEKHLWVRKESLIVDSMGIKRNQIAGDAPEVTLDVLQNVEGRSLVVSLVTLPGATAPI